MQGLIPDKLTNFLGHRLKIWILSDSEGGEAYEIIKIGDIFNFVIFYRY